MNMKPNHEREISLPVLISSDKIMHKLLLASLTLRVSICHLGSCFHMIIKYRQQPLDFGYIFCTGDVDTVFVVPYVVDAFLCRDNFDWSGTMTFCQLNPFTSRV
jgi:hypothetical protein